MAQHTLPVPTLDQRVRSQSTRRRLSSDLYDGVLWRMRSNFVDPSQLAVVGFISNKPNMGVTTVASHVAVRAADHHFGRVLLVDANLPSSGLSRSFRLRKSAGLADYMDGSVELDTIVCQTSIEGLYVLPAGKGANRQHLTMQPSHAADLVGELRARFDFVVFDLGQAFDMNSSSLLAREMDASVLVLRSDACRRDDVRRETQTLLDDKINIIGSVLTRHRRYLPSWLERWL